MVKLAISNIAWTGNDERVFELLASLGVSGVEVAPGKVTGSWDTLDVSKIKKFRNQCESFGLCIPSFQAFLFGKPELQLLGEPSVFQAMLKHVDFVAELAATAGAKVLVYGAPKSRLLLNHSFEEAERKSFERLERLAETCWSYGVSIGLEAVPEVYAGEFITSYRDSLRIVKKINHPGLVFHLDTGCTYLNNESIVDAIVESGSCIEHFHISQPHLADFSDPSSFHAEAALALKRINYNHWRCIEMRESENSLESIQKAVEYVSKTY